jgi:pimeloyl-ACP methyl ester carboxylesterase
VEIVANGIKLHVQRLGHQPGRPPIVVFIHGLVIDNMSSLYYSLANPVAKAGADAILYDMRGHGLSERPPTGYTLDDSVADLVGLLDALAVEHPVHVVGHSYGASVALRAAILVPDRLASLVLIEPHCWESEDGGEWMEDIADMLSANALNFERNQLPELAPSDLRRVKWLVGMNALLNETTLVDQVASAPVFTEEEMASLEVPVLAVYGEHLATSARKLADAVPGCRLEIVPDVAHSVLRDETNEVLGLLLEWLDGDALEKTG